MQVQDLINSIISYYPNADTELIRRAYTFAREKHEGQIRSSGEPYITHVSEVANLATKLKLDTASIITALLHDTVEDTGVTIEEIEGKFGKSVATLVDGVTKLEHVKFNSKIEEQAENFRKMLLAMSKDIRVILIKLCDRLHNMRTLQFLSQARRERIAQETIDIYAPLANRLGIHWLKSELEDLCLYHLKPEVYEKIKASVNNTRKDRDKYTAETIALLKRELEQNEINAEISGRAKHFYSIYSKMDRSGVNYDEINDLMAFRIITGSIKDCYGALGVIHSAWKPVPGRFKDYIAMPKSNNYQSLHTTLIGPRGHRIEIQIRTKEMHDIAEKGIAAHWNYKESGEESVLKPIKGFEFNWLRELVESEKMLRDPDEFISTVKEDLFSRQVFVFSPKGDLIALTAGSTPIDFAFQIHSELGLKINGAKVNGQQISLNHKLKNGDTIEVTTSINQTPHKDWLNFVVTSKARQRIRAWLRTEERAKAITVGKEILIRDFRKIKLNYHHEIKDKRFETIVKELGYKELESLLADVCYGKITSASIIKKLSPVEEDVEKRLEEQETFLQKIFKKAAGSMKSSSGIKISGMDDIVFRFASCCEPLPGDPLVGYISTGRGVTVHIRGCSQTLSYNQSRMIPVSWDENTKAQRKLKINVYSVDKIGVLADLTNVISKANTNIISAQSKTDSDGKAINIFEILISDSEQLNNVIKQLENVQGVIQVDRHRGRKRTDTVS